MDLKQLVRQPPADIVVGVSVFVKKYLGSWGFIFGQDMFWGFQFEPNYWSGVIPCYMLAL